MIDEINKDFHNKWKDFPGNKNLKLTFVFIGFVTWLEFFLPQLNFGSHLAGLLWETGNLFAGLASFILIVGVLACALLWLPTYVWSIIKFFK